MELIARLLSTLDQSLQRNGVNEGARTAVRTELEQVARREFGGSGSYISQRPDPNARRSRVLAAALAGERVCDIARREGLTERHVYRIVSKHISR